MSSPTSPVLVTAEAVTLSDSNLLEFSSRTGRTSVTGQDIYSPVVCFHPNTWKYFEAVEDDSV